MSELDRLRNFWWLHWIDSWALIGNRYYDENGEHDGCPNDCAVCEANSRVVMRAMLKGRR